MMYYCFIVYLGLDTQGIACVVNFPVSFLCAFDASEISNHPLRAREQFTLWI